MKLVSLEQVIKQYIPLPPRPSARGWYPIICKACNDHGKKGPRAGFRFSPEEVGYHCFNCGRKSTQAVSSTTMHSVMEEVLTAFGVPKEEWQATLFNGLVLNDGSSGRTNTSDYAVDLDLAEIELPPHFYPVFDPTIDSGKDKWNVLALEYLMSRGITASSYQFYLSNHPDWVGRLIIPIYKDKKVVFYQGRDMTETRTRKYKSAAVPKEKVMYGFDRIYENSSAAPLYVVEGFFDAYVIDGVGVLGNEFSKQQIRHLQMSRRPKVVIPDRRGDGHVLAHQALKQGWSVSFPDIGDAKDVNEAVQLYGKLYVVDSIIKNTMTGFMAETAVGVYCEKSKNHKKSGKRKDKKPSG